MCRDEQFAYLQANTSPEDSKSGRDLIHMGLLDDDFRHLLFIRSLLLPMLVASKRILEPYYPNQFALL